MALRVVSRFLPAYALACLLILCTACQVDQPSPHVPHYVTVTGPRYVLPKVAGYQASVPASPGATYAWTIVNGTILSGSTTDAITFQVGDIREGADLDISCTKVQGGTTYTGDLQPGVFSFPVPYSTDSEIGVLRHGTETLTVDAASSLTYQWSITGGEILEGQGTPTITYFNGPMPGVTELAQPAAVEITFSLTVADGSGAFQPGPFLIGEELYAGEAPSQLVYETTQATYTVGKAIPMLLQHSRGGSVDQYSVSPPLPPGLVLDTNTGFISGTPTAPAAPSAYTVTATNVLGSTTATLNLAAVDAAPAGLAYAYASGTFTKGVAIAPDAPSSSGGAIASYAVSPSLPMGLSLDPATGILSGTPAALTPQAAYTVTATNETGSVQAVMTLTVNDAPPSGLAYTYTTNVFTAGTAIAADKPSNTGGAVVSYAVSPSLPTGLSLDPSTGILSGTPSNMAAQAIYTVTATNTGGFATLNLSLEVDASIAITTQPSNLATFSGRRATFTVAATGGATLTYQWQKNSTAIPGATSASYLTPVLAAADSGAQYSVLVSASGGSPLASASATLTVAQALPRFAYAANSTDGTLSAYTVNAATGQLRPNGYVLTGARPAAVVVEPTEQFVFVANQGDHTVSSYAMLPSGALTAVNTLASGQGPCALATDPSGAHLYVANSVANTVSAYTIGNVGTLASLGADVAAGNAPVALAVASSGRFAYVVNQADATVQAYTVGTDGSLHGKGPAVPTGASASAIAISPAGTFVCVAASADVWTYPIDPATGRLGTSVSTAAGASLAGVAFDPSGAYLFVSDAGSGSGGAVLAYAFDATSGALTAKTGPTSVDAGTGAVAVDPSGTFVYAVNAGKGEVTVCAWNAVAPSLTKYRDLRSRQGTASLAVSLGASAVLYQPGFVYVAEKTAYPAPAPTPDPGFVSGFILNASSGNLGPLPPFGMPVTSGSTSTTTWVSTDLAGRFAYATNFDDNTLSIYTIDAGFGILTPGGTASTDPGPGVTVVDPSGRFLFCTTSQTPLIDAFQIGSGGSLTPMTSGTTQAIPKTLAMDPTGRFLYTATTAGLEALLMDPVSGALTSITRSSPVAFGAGAGTTPVQVAVDPTGRFVYVASTTSASGVDAISSFAIDAASGLPTAISGSPLILSPTPAQQNVSGLAVDGAGTFAYLTLNPGASSTGALQVLSLDAVTGLPTAVGSSLATHEGGTQNPVIDPSGAFLLFPDTTGYYSTYAIAPNTGLLTPVQDLLDFIGPPLPANGTPQAMVVTAQIQ